MSDERKERKGEIFDFMAEAVKRGKKPADSRPSAVFVGNGNVLGNVTGDVNPLRITVNTRPAPQLVMNPGPQHITPGQAVEIRGLVNRIARKKGKNYQRVWGHLQDRFRFTSYHLLPADQFDAVLAYLQAWVTAPACSEARQALLRRIHAQAERFPGGIAQVKADFGVASLRAQSDEELAELANALRYKVS